MRLDYAGSESYRLIAPCKEAETQHLKLIGLALDDLNRVMLRFSCEHCGGHVAELYFHKGETHLEWKQA